MSERMSPNRPPMAIIGSGLSGLSLARALNRHNIPYTIYDRSPCAFPTTDSSSSSLHNATSPSHAITPRHDYALTLHPRCLTPLLRTLDISEQAFRKRVAVPWPPSYSDSSSRRSPEPLSFSNALEENDDGSIRVHRGRLEELIGRGVNVQWDSQVESIEVTESPGRDGEEVNGVIELRLSDGRTFKHECVVAADGVHSVVRKNLLPEREPQVLPYVAFNGKRRIDRVTFDSDLASAFRDTSVLESRVGDVTLRLDIFECTDDEVGISWIYSRKPRQDETDLLFTPNRPNSAATDIPDDFYAEVRSLQTEMPSPFSEIFDVEKLKGTRLLSWLMRTTEVPVTELKEMASKGVYMIGDAIHAEPILGGHSANAAILDGLQLAETIADQGIHRIAEWYETKYPEWKRGVGRSKEDIDKMHTDTRSTL